MLRNFDEYKEIIEEHLLDFIPKIDEKSSTLYNAMKYSLVAGGKRLRPVILLAATDFAGGDIYEALPYAIAMEYIHTYSLIHDDLPAMDDDDLRRGNPTNHKVFGEAMAILAGDGLLNTAFELMNKDMMLYLDEPEKLGRKVKAAYEISKGAGVTGMVAGQVSDIESEDIVCSKEMLEFIHLNKTGALIKSSIRAGLFLAGAKSNLIDDFTIFAECLGLAFQIQDDILDVVGTTEEIGKTAGKDLKQNKNTYVSQNGLQTAKKRLDELTDNAVEAIKDYGEETEFFVKLAQNLRLRRN